MEQMISQRFSVTFSFQVHFCRGLFKADNPLFANLFDASEGATGLMFVVDEGVYEAHPNLLEEISIYCGKFPQLDLRGEVLVVPGGEEAKNVTEWVELLIEKVEAYHIDRHSYLVAIGGGAVLDMAGFAAAIAHRGVRHIRIPTTVLSQNDSGVGVKNGINYFGKKNFVGSFAPPAMVINDFDFLTTLDDRDWRGGISEAVKVSLIKDQGFYEWIEFNARSLAQRDDKSMEYLIVECAKLHMDHIAGGDPFEMGSSRPLDFGHWSAHKLEQLSDFQIRHGEAVALGISLDTLYSSKTGRISEADARRVLDLFKELGFQMFHPDLEKRAENGQLLIWKGLQEFREHLGGELTIMLLDAIGKGVEVHEMDEAILEECLEALKQYALSYTAVE